MRQRSETKWKAGDRLRVDVRIEAYYQKRGIAYLHGVFVQYDEDGDAIVLIDGNESDEVRRVSDLYR